MNGFLLLNQARQHFRALDLDLPAELQSELDKLDALAQRQTEALRYSPADLAAAVVAAVDAGRDPATDKSVTALLARRGLADVGLDLDAALGARRDAVVVEHAGALIEAARDVVEKADQVLDQARAAIPGLDLTDPAFVSTLPPAVMTLWGQAREALSRVERVGQLWVLISQTVAGYSAHQNARPLMLADLSATELDALPLGGHGRTPHAAALAGHRLDLATPDSYRERVARVTEDRQQQERQIAQEERARRPSLVQPAA